MGNETKKDVDILELERKFRFYIVLHGLFIVLPIVAILFIFFASAITKLIILVYYILIIPLVTWLMGKILKNTKATTVYLLSQLICLVIFISLIVLSIIFVPTSFGNEVLNYFSAIAIAVVLYYIYGNPKFVKKVDSIETIPNAFRYTQRELGRVFDYTYLRTFIFLFYLCILVFGHLRDIGVHSSRLFIYEQYAVIIIIAIDRLFVGFGIDMKKREIVKSIECKKDYFDISFDTIQKELSNLITLEPELEIDKVDYWDKFRIWDNFNTSENPDHPRTKLIQQHLFLSTVTNSKTNEKINELFSLLGKKAKEQAIVIDEN